MTALNKTGDVIAICVCCNMIHCTCIRKRNRRGTAIASVVTFEEAKLCWGVKARASCGGRGAFETYFFDCWPSRITTNAIKLPVARTVVNVNIGLIV